MPLFFYIVHICLIHALAVVAGRASDYPVADMLQRKLPPGYGFGLPAVYLLWLGAIATLYPLAVWDGRVKAKGRGWWWGYL